MSYANGGDTKARAHSPSEGNVVDHHAAGGVLEYDIQQKLQVNSFFLRKSQKRSQLDRAGLMLVILPLWSTFNHWSAVRCRFACFICFTRLYFSWFFFCSSLHTPRILALGKSPTEFMALFCKAWALSLVSAVLSHVAHCRTPFAMFSKVCAFDWRSVGNCSHCF